MNVNSGAALGSGLVYFNGNSTLQAGAASVSLPASLPLTINNGATANFDTQANSMTIAGPITSNGTLNVVGTGLLDIVANGNSNYGGTTTVSGGTLQFDLTGVPEYAGNRLGTISIGAGGSLNFTNTGSATDYGLIGFTTFTGNGTINKTGTGYLDFWSGTSIANFAGNINVLQGTLATNTSDWGSSAGSMNLYIAPGAAFDVRGNNVVINQLSGGGTIYSSGGGQDLTVGRKGRVPPTAARYSKPFP